MALTSSKVRLAAMNILAGREHSKKELADKLTKKYHAIQSLDDEDFKTTSEATITENIRGKTDRGTIEEIIELVISQLIDDNLLNESRFTEVYIRSKKNKGVGPVKIRYELKNKGIDSELMNEFLSSISNDEWLDDICFQREKKYGKLLPDNLKEKTRQSRFLYQRGYPVELINQVLS